MDDSIRKAIQIKQKELEAIEPRRTKLLEDLSALERALEITLGLNSRKDTLVRHKTSFKQQNEERTSAVVKVLREAGTPVHYEEIAQKLGGKVSPMAIKVWLKDQVTRKRDVCPWVFGVNKSYYKLKPPVF
ncbi:MAG TPA: hypothetical protein VI913_03520 [Candidatus Peribacteraceae bacterium]|nr:hypothetical protein [Candidatus Peribacteraceae bacterium]